MNRLLQKKQVLTIPNILSMFRLLLLPFIVWLYVFEDNSLGAIILLFISGISDIADGYIARRFNMVSDFGKILDPIADKFTQGVLLICLAVTHDIIFYLIVAFVIKEFLMALMGYLTYKNHDSVNSAKWYGKLNTVVIYSAIVILLFLPDLSQSIVNIIIFTCIFVLLASFALYIRFYLKILKPKKES